MKIFIQMIAFAFVGIFSQNLVFTGGLGASKVIRLATYKKNTGKMCLYISFFSLIGSLIFMPITEIIGRETQLTALRLMIFVFLLTIIYFIVLLVSKKFFAKHYPWQKEHLSSCLYNCVVIGVPFICSSMNINITNSIAFSLGSSLGFFIAVTLLGEANERLDNPDMCKSFLGLPIFYLYIAILSMVFIGFSGTSYIFNY